MKNKVINCAKCGTNPWKQGCYALWGKDGYVCSVCAIGIAERSKTLWEELDGKEPSHDFAEKYKKCPVYGRYQN